MSRYNPKELEPKWQKIWDETGVYTADLNSSKPKYIAMSMFNYPSGAGIHVGHAMNFTISDVKARFKRQQGFESYHPVGWDSFGLPAENYAIKAGVSPQQSMAKIIPDYHKQYKAMGWSNDWEKEITTSEPEYYKWTQWIFVKMYENGLAYQDSRWQWWCTKCQTVLANEQVIDGKCWRHEGKDDPIVEKKEVKQWFFKITDYAEELLNATDDLDWTESVKLAQKNWIGKSEGVELDFKVEGSDKSIKVFTTRVDTLYGVTFMVLAPDHELVKELTLQSSEKEVATYIKETTFKSELERQVAKEKTGVFLGSFAINPINGQKIPIYIADYVLSGYGTGAIMAVPAHDERDYEFAQKYNLQIVPVVQPQTDYCVSYIMGADDISNEDISSIGGKILNKTDSGHLYVCFPKSSTSEYVKLIEDKMESGFWNEYVGDNIEFIFKDKAGEITRLQLNEKNHDQILKLGQKFNSQPDDPTASVYDWIANNTYYGNFYLENSKSGTLINSGVYDNLSVEKAKKQIAKDLSEQKIAEIKINYRMRDWSISRQRYWGAPIPVVNCPKCGPVVLSEKDLPVVLPELDDFQPSGDGRSALARAKDWLETTCPKCTGPAERETDTMDTYVCSSWYMFRYLDPRNTEEIFDSKTANKWMPLDFYNGGDHATAHLLYARFITRFFKKIGLTNQAEPFKQMLFNGKVMASDGSAFSKTLGNGPDPLEIINSGYGADALRTYLMFAAPLEFSARWDSQGVPGAHRFLSRLYNIVTDYVEKTQVDLNEEDISNLKYISSVNTKKVTEDIEASRYNTAIASSMESLNKLYLLKDKIPFGKNNVWTQTFENLVMCIAPFAPHLAEELWQKLGHTDSVNKDHWPLIDQDALQSKTILIVVQVNGKVRAKINVDADLVDQQILEQAKADTHVQEFIKNKEIIREIYVKGRLVNLVVK